MAIKNKSVLITSGPTWVAIDSVRVISNIATGETGLLLAERLAKLGAKVTLILGPVEACCLNKKIRVLRFRFFNELKNIIFAELKSKKYDILIHAAAVSDFRPKLTYKQKIDSHKRELRLNLVPTPKIISFIKKLRKNIFLVGFKFIPQAKRSVLIKASNKLLQESGADLVVANTIDKARYSAYLIEKNSTDGPLASKKIMAKHLIKRF
ncbi:MAG: phosphopantothenoylcysteine decarboxylase [Candidatus Omnitrophica bacterium]|nr:phosphopantothenoylcysteine decarboxylase [Candidatus Omnitrophota bacterium]